MNGKKMHPSAFLGSAITRKASLSLQNRISYSGIYPVKDGVNCVRVSQKAIFRIIVISIHNAGSPWVAALALLTGHGFQHLGNGFQQTDVQLLVLFQLRFLQQGAVVFFFIAFEDDFYPSDVDQELLNIPQHPERSGKTAFLAPVQHGYFKTFIHHHGIKIRLALLTTRRGLIIERTKTQIYPFLSN